MDGDHGDRSDDRVVFSFIYLGEVAEKRGKWTTSTWTDRAVDMDADVEGCRAFLSE